MLVAEITRVETRQRARLLRVHSYDVALDFTGGEEIFGSVSVIRFDCAEPGAASNADLVARRVHEITLNGVPLDPAAVYAGGRIALPALAAQRAARRGRLRLHQLWHGHAPVGWLRRRRNLHLCQARAGLRPHRLRVLRSAGP